MRTCGDCRQCCFVFPLPVLGKPVGRWCRLLGPGGCTVHDAGKPEVCRRYACYWLEHEELSEELRPDRIGLVVTESGTASVGGHTLPIAVINMAEADSDRGPAAQALLAELLAGGGAVFLLHGPDLRILFDRARYPGIGPDEIEEAFRHELSRDAEDLRRLGAVGTDFGKP